MIELNYSTGYAADQWQSEEFYGISKILRMELLLSREQTVNNYQIPLMKIRDYRLISDTSQALIYLTEKFDSILSHLNIGCVNDGDLEEKQRLLLRYNTGEDAKKLDQMYVDIDNNGYGDYFFVHLSLDKYKDITEEKRAFIKETLLDAVDSVASYLECCMGNREYEFSDGCVIYAITFQYIYEIENSFATLLNNMSKLKSFLEKEKQL